MSQDSNMETHDQDEVIKWADDHLQALVSMAGEDWREKLRDCGEQGSELHLLRPTTLHLDLYKCLIVDDPNLARIKVDISLPNVALTVAG